MSFMKWLRATLRITLVSLWTLGIVVTLRIGLLFMIPFPRLAARWRSFIFKNWSRGLLLIAGVRRHTVGNPPEAPFLLVSNHLSYIDIAVLGSLVGGVFVAKSEISDWPVVGFVCRSVQTIFIDREMRRGLPGVMHEIERQLGHGQGIIVFPEGTSSSGASVLPFRPALLESAAQSDLPVSYATLSYATPEGEPPAHLSVCWWGGAPFGPHAFEFFKLRRVDATVVFGNRQFQGGDRKVLANELRTAVLKNFRPVVDPEDLRLHRRCEPSFEIEASRQ
jgi:1-acyl-sn-glycerol-3-phosphate acyltransferase